MRTITDDMSEHVKRVTGYNLGADNLHVGMKYLREKHQGFKDLPSHRQRDYEAALKKELRIEEPKQEEAD